ncbi:restriction endonuclease subunit S [Brevibacterium sp. 'Marine']|uniref:restriction endonuclease subunit S n=1 Tax=Brevibacterium sp. 'Marine' TaxID=2725563 RepID=UPI00145EDDA3|nr:restriction endonuclease subunit S [Brevibacterium sp. 'Marine']
MNEDLIDSQNRTKGRLKWDARLVSGGTPSTNEASYWTNYGALDGTPFVAIADMSGRERINETNKALTNAGMQSRNMPVGDPGTLLLAMYASVGEVSLLGIQATWNQALLGITPDPRCVNAQYLRYVLLAMRPELLRDVRSTTQDNLNAGQIGDIWYLKPPLSEQRAVADYLDQETTQIDELVAKQEEFIGLLKERKSSLVTHEVVHAVAERNPLRRVVDVIDCAHVTADFVDDERYPVASIRECQGATVDLTGCNYTTEEFYNHLRSSGRAPRVGDLLFVRNVSVGLVAEVAPGTRDFAIGQETVLLRRKTNIDPKFLRYALTSAEVGHAIENAMIGATFRRINVSAIRALPVPVPPLEEQTRIATRLEQQISRIDALITKAEEHIALAKERRAALITAAVTGQFDVRTARKAG